MNEATAGTARGARAVWPDVLQRLELTLLALASELVYVVIVLIPLIPFVMLQRTFFGGTFALALSGVLFLLLWWMVQPSPGNTDGQVLSRDEAPVLFAMVDELSVKADSPRLHRIVLSNELNAGAYQTGGFLSLWGSRRTLILGIPLLRLLSPDEARAVIAHELGHFSRNHGRLGHWIYRVRAKWEHYLHAPDSNHFIDDSLKRVAGWFVPYFVRRSSERSRRCEFEADAVAARIASPIDLTGSLARLEFTHFILRKKQAPELNALRIASPQAPGDFWDSVAALVDRHWTLMDSALADPSVRQQHPRDTHPPLHERAAALGLDQVSPGALQGPTAGEALAGSTWRGALESCNSQWQKASEPGWRFDHLRLKWLTGGGAAFLTAGTSGQGAALAEAIVADQLRHDDDTLVALADLAGQQPAMALACYYLGLARLQRDDSAGVDDLRHAISLDKRLARRAQDAICGHFAGGDAKTLGDALLRRKKTLTRLAPVYQHVWKNLIRGPLRAVPPGSSPLLAEVLGGEAIVDASWLAQLELPDTTGLMHEVNVLVVRIDAGQAHAQGLDEDALRARYVDYLLAVSPPGQLALVHTVYTSEPIHPRLLQQLQAVPESMVIAPKTPVNTGIIRIDSL